jgi:plastocyanin
MMTIPRFAGLCAVGGLLMVSCAPDGPDAYAAPGAVEAPPATRAPSTTEADGAADDEGAAGDEDAADDGGAADAAPTETFPPNGETVVVLGVDNTFREETIEIEAGTEVLWENRGRNDHNLLPADEAADWGAQTDDFLPGDEYTHVFDTPGEYPYYCSIHGTAEVGMIGTVIVTG